MTKKHDTLLASFRALVKKREFEVNATAKRLNVSPKRVRNCIDMLRAKGGHKAVVSLGNRRFRVVA